MSWADMTDGPTFYRRTVAKGGVVRALGVVFTSPALVPHVGDRVMVVDGFPDLIEVRVYHPDRPVGRRTGTPLLSVHFESSGRVQVAYGRRPPLVDGELWTIPLVAVDVAYLGQTTRTLFDCKYRPPVEGARPAGPTSAAAPAP